jgi:hypothetical protein
MKVAPDHGSFCTPAALIPHDNPASRLFSVQPLPSRSLPNYRPSGRRRVPFRRFRAASLTDAEQPSSTDGRNSRPGLTQDATLYAGRPRLPATSRCYPPLNACGSFLHARGCLLLGLLPVSTSPSARPACPVLVQLVTSRAAPAQQPLSSCILPLCQFFEYPSPLHSLLRPADHLVA